MARNHAYAAATEGPQSAECRRSDAALAGVGGWTDLTPHRADQTAPRLRYSPPQSEVWVHQPIQSSHIQTRWSPSPGSVQGMSRGEAGKGVFRPGGCALVSVVSAVVLMCNLAAAGHLACHHGGLVLYTAVFSTNWTRERFPKQYPEFRPPAQWSRVVGKSRCIDAGYLSQRFKSPNIAYALTSAVKYNWDSAY